MYISLVFLSSWLCLITHALITYDQKNKGITSTLGYSIPGNTEFIRFDVNSITHVQAGYFKNLPNLTKIHLFMNDISNIDDYAFANISTVTYISLGTNKLSVIRENMFSGLPNLSKLYLYSNLIHTIESRSFKDNTVLTLLALERNSLQSIPQCMFNPKNHPTGLNEFRIHTNPLSCTEFLCWLKQIGLRLHMYISQSVPDRAL